MKILFPKAIHHLDRFFIYNSLTNCILEGHFNYNRAERYCDIINNHEIKNNREPVYRIILKDKVSYD